MDVWRRPQQWVAEGTALVILSVLYFVDLFLPWSQQCTPIRAFPGPAATFPGFGHATAHVSALLCHAQGDGWGGAGTVAGVLVALLAVWEGTRVARLAFGLGAGHRSLISAALGFGVLLFTAVNVAAQLTWMQVGSLLYGGAFLWVSLALGIVIAAGAWLHWRIWQGAPLAADGPVTIPPETPPPPPPGTCPSCQHLNELTAYFCSNCGATLPSPSSVPRRRRPPRPTSGA